MLLSILDPDLLVYNFDDWQAREPHCDSRLGILSLHIVTTRRYGQRMAMSTRLADFVSNAFPWGCEYRGIPQLRELRRLVFQELQRVAYYDLPIDAILVTDISLQPGGIVCQYLEDANIIEAWEELLCSCVDDAVLTEFDPQIATRESPTLCEHSGPMILEYTLLNPEAVADTRVCHIPLVWDDDSWATQLTTQQWWPNLQQCVELCFRTNPSMGLYPEARQQPIPFECTDSFRKSLDRLCRGPLRRSLVEALTKRVHGILDASLGDEAFGEGRRFRVTAFWRVHYREEAGRVILEEFGQHSMGGVD